MGIFNSSRNSKDETVNARGAKFLEMCSDFGLIIILNGRSNGDPDGNYTFCRASASDLVCISLDAVSFLSNFWVLQETFSDHMPISLAIPVRKRIPVMNLLPLLKWYCSRKKVFNERFVRALTGLDMVGCSNELLTPYIIEAIKAALFYS